MKTLFHHIAAGLGFIMLEAGTRYDFSQCGDSKLADLYALCDANVTDIKARGAMLKTCRRPAWPIPIRAR